MKQGGIMGFGISRSKQRAFIRHLLFTRLELMHLIPPSKGPHDVGAVLVDFTLVTLFSVQLTSTLLIAVSLPQRPLRLM